jgi:hypothetical protein
VPFRSCRLKTAAGDWQEGSFRIKLPVMIAGWELQFKNSRRRLLIESYRLITAF